MKWEEPDLPEIPKAHSLFASAWKKVGKDLQRIKSGVVDPGYRFPKPTLFAGVSMPERKKTYLFNWLSARALWISRVDVCPPSKFPSPQMWRDFLNTIDTNKASSSKSASTKMAVRDILGEDIIHSGRGLAEAPKEITWRGMQVSVSSFFFGSTPLQSYVMQVRVSSLSDLPLQLMRSLLWELYEFNFRYELYSIDRALVPDLWTKSDDVQLARITLLYSIFPGGSGLGMWSEPLPQEPSELGMCAADVQTAFPYFNSFRELLSAWPQAPSRLQSPAQLDGQENSAVFEQQLLACQFYVQTAFDLLG
jgi:hypothetical protein